MPRRSRWPSRIAIALALGLAAAGVFSLMQTISLSDAKDDLRTAQARTDRLEGRIDSLQDELGGLKDDLHDAQSYGASCHSALKGIGKALKLIGASGRAFLNGDVIEARSLAQQAKAALRDVDADATICLDQAPSEDAVKL
jgi:hypothetical protein